MLNNKKAPDAGEYADGRGAVVDLSKILKVGAVAVELGLLILLVKAFKIESDAFFQLLILMLGGFVVHALLPLRYRMGFFSIAARCKAKILSTFIL